MIVTDETTKEAVPAGFKPTPHPLLPIPTREELSGMMTDDEQATRVMARLMEREELIRLAESRPVYHEFQLDSWRDASKLLEDVILLIVFGGNRASKSEFAAHTICRNALKYPDSVFFCLHEGEKSSIATQQKLVWKFLAPEVGHLNRKHNSVYKINYSISGGFTDGKVVLPNRTEIYFLSYAQDSGAFEGWELGSRDASIAAVWCDENMPMPWLKTLLFRLASRAAKMIWTYAPVRGMTPVIKEIIGSSARTLRSRFAELLADRQNLPGLPIGHMPYIQQPYMEKARVIYFHSDRNPFGLHYSHIKDLCKGMPAEFVEKRAYGYAREVSGRRFPLFGEWNIIKPEHLPTVGTNYQFLDPAGARNWATFWVRVGPGSEPKYYIYRDWPDCRRFGEWATTSNNPNRFDGDRGPAQSSLGYGIEQYRSIYREEERGEMIFQRYIDSRAGHDPIITDKGGTCISDEFAVPKRDPRTNKVIANGMVFLSSSGERSTQGETAVNDLLFWNPDKQMDAVMNTPHLFVTDNCRQVIWSLQNWTGLDGETGASKDWIDLVRYMALARLRFVEIGAPRYCGRGGGY